MAGPACKTNEQDKHIICISTREMVRCRERALLAKGGMQKGQVVAGRLIIRNQFTNS